MAALLAIGRLALMSMAVLTAILLPAALPKEASAQTNGTIRSVVVTRSGAGGPVGLCDSITLNIDVDYDPFARDNDLDYAIQEENGAGRVIAIVKRETITESDSSGDNSVSFSADVSHCTAGARFYRGVAQLEDTGSNHSALVTVEWAGSATITVFTTVGPPRAELKLHNAMRPDPWAGIVLQLQYRGIADQEGVWKDEGGLLNVMPRESVVTSDVKATRQYRWQIRKGDLELYSNIVLLFWSSPQITPTPFAIPEDQASRLNQTRLSAGQRYTTIAPEIVDYDVDDYANCDARPGVLISLTWNLSEHAERYQVTVDGDVKTLVNDSSLSGYAEFCLQGDSGVSVVQVQGLIDNKDQLPYELRRADGAVVIIPANAVVVTPPAEVAIRWDRAATGNPYIPTARDEVAEPENVAIEGATELAAFIAGFVGASPDRVNVLLPLLAFLFAAAGAAFIMVPLGFSPPSMVAGGSFSLRSGPWAVWRGSEYRRQWR